MQQILKATSRQIREKKIIRSSQHGFTKGKSCLTNLIKSYNDLSDLTDEESAADIVYLDFNEVFNNISHKILIENLLIYRLDERTLRWTKNWLNGQVQRVVLRSMAPSWKPVTTGVCWESVLHSVLFNIFNDLDDGAVYQQQIVLMTQNWEG